MHIKSLSLFPEVKLVIPDIYEDKRGVFLEVFQKKKFHEMGIDFDFVQSNHSFSKKDVIRGMHFQINPPQTKLVYVPQGEILDVVVDVREESTTFGLWEGMVLSEHNRYQLLIPGGFAHGFCVLSETANVIYLVDQFYDPSKEKTFHYADSSVGILWPAKEAIVSEKDQNSVTLREILTCIG